MRKILVLRFSSLGDIVMATPAVRALRRKHPLAQIDMAVREDFLDLIRDNPHIDQKIGLPRGEGISGLWRLLREANRERYDLVYDAHRSLRSRFLMPFLKAEAKCYYRKHYLRRSVALTFKLKLLEGARGKRMLERYHDPLVPWGVSYDGLGPEIFLSNETRERAREKAGPLPAGGAKTIGIIPSAQWPGKRWPPGRFRRVLELLMKETSHGAVLLGGPEDTFCEALARDLPRDRVLNAQGKLSIAETAAVIDECDLVIANDTGLMHLADALDVPSVLILGPTSAEMGCLPYHPKSIVLEHHLWCRPCSKNGQAPCIRGRRLCLELTTPEAVFGAARTLAANLREGTA